MASSLAAQFDITVYRASKSSGVYSWSPFVCKLEARFRFGGLPYRTDAGSMSKAPRGKIPYISISKADSGDAPRVLGDSTLIAHQLAVDGILEDLNAKLSPTDKALDLAIRALVEDKLYWYQCYERWHDNYYPMRSGVLGELSYPVQLVVGLLAYRKIMQILHGQGTSRYSAAEISLFKQQAWENVEALLAASKSKKRETNDDHTTFWVLMGDEPSEADTVLFGFIASALVCDAAPESQKIVRSLPSVMDYAQRIHNRYFPDYVFWD